VVNRYQRIRVGCITVACVVAGAAPLFGQDSSRAEYAERPLTPEEMTPSGYATAVRLFSDSLHGLHLVQNGHLIMRRDSVNIAVDSMAKSWIVALQRTPVNPNQRLQLAQLHIAVRQDAEARAKIAEVLARPGLTAADRAWVLTNVIGYFLDTDSLPTPARMQIAREYFAQLCALPLQKSIWGRFWSLDNIMTASARMGRTEDAIDAGDHAYALVPQIEDFYSRVLIAGDRMFLKYAVLLSGQPRGRARIDSVMKVLEHAVTLSSAEIARDTALRPLEIGGKETLHRLAQIVSLIGVPAPAVVATHWLNQTTPTTVSDAAPGARTLTLNDGVIRIIGFGFFNCIWCQRAMGQMQKEHTALPRGVQMNYYEWTEGHWGADLVTPDEEVQHLRRYYVERKKFTYPIAIWAGPKDSTDEGGVVPRRSSTMNALGLSGGPTFIVIDGHGIVRYWQSGYNTYQADLKPIVDQLVRERDHQAASSTPRTPTAVPSPPAGAP